MSGNPSDKSTPKEFVLKIDPSSTLYVYLVKPKKTNHFLKFREKNDSEEILLDFQVIYTNLC